MRLILHSLPIQCPAWVTNDPMAAGGAAALSAYYAVLFAQPELILWEGEVHVVPSIGFDGMLPKIPPGEKVFYDGLPLNDRDGLGPQAPAWRRLTALKERLITEHGAFLIPENLELGVWTDPTPSGWTGAGDRDGQPFFLSDADRFLSPVHTGYTDFLLRRDRGRLAQNWRLFTGQALTHWVLGRDIRFRAHHEEEARLRDTFGAFGFHVWVVKETARLLDLPPGLETAQAHLKEAATAFVAERYDQTEQKLAAAFDALRETLDRLSGTKERLFAEGHHGGMLHDDIGFFEHDWPQMVCDILREALAYKGVVISLDMPANVFRYYRERFPAFFEELCAWLEEGRLELLNGMFGQPFSDTHSLENLLSQCLLGQQELREIFGREAAVFASEEYCIGPGMAQILAASGYRRAVHAVRLGGVSGQSGPVVQRWQATAGEGELEVIEHPDLIPQGISTGYFLQLPKALAETRRRGYARMALFNIPDFGWNILFRDELFTGLEYGEPIFQMQTFEQLFDRLEHRPDPIPAAWEDSYHTIFNHYTIRGNMRFYFERLRQVELSLVALEAEQWASQSKTADLEPDWRDYLLGSSHDYTIVGHGFNGWYGTAVKATYAGPNQSTFARTLESEMLRRFARFSDKAQAQLQRDGEGHWLRNPHGFPVTLPLPGLNETTETITLPPFGTLALPARASLRVPEGAGELNGRGFHAVVDPETGTLEHATLHGQSLWKGHRIGLSLPGRTVAVREGCLSAPIASEDGLRLIHRGRLVDLTETSEPTLGWVETLYQWHPASADLSVEVLFAPATIPARSQFNWDHEWTQTFRYALPRLNRSGRLHLSQGNALFTGDPAQRSAGALAGMVPDAQAHVLSPELLGQEAQAPLWFYNDGFPLYFVYDDRIEQPLRLPGEHHLRLRFGIGFGETGCPPLQRSRTLMNPPFRTAKPIPALPISWGDGRIGLLRIESRPEATPRLWFFNYHSAPVTFLPESSLVSFTPPANATGPLEADGNGWKVGGYELFSMEIGTPMAPHPLTARYHLTPQS